VTTVGKQKKVVMAKLEAEGKVVSSKNSLSKALK